MTDAPRIFGALAGLVLGDVLGSAHDSRDRAAIADALRALARGDVVRDERPPREHVAVALTLAAARAYGSDGFRLARATDALVDAVRDKRDVVGAQTREALARIERGDSTGADAGVALLEERPHAAGNGSLMRACPTGLARVPGDARLVRESMLLSAVTHAHPSAVGACVAANAALSALVAGAEPMAALAAARAVVADDDELREAREIVDDVLDGWPPVYQGAAPGFALLCLERALRALAGAGSFEEGLVDVVAAGGDSDTSGAVAGALLGARFPEAAAHAARALIARLALDGALTAATAALAGVRASAAVGAELESATRPPRAHRPHRPRVAFTPRVFTRADVAANAGAAALAGVRAAFAEDGFVIVAGLFDGARAAAAADRFGPVFGGTFETGVIPDEIRWRPGIHADTLTREIRNVWRADRTLGALVVDEEVGRIAALLGGWSGARINQAGALWKPAGGDALAMHQDQSYIDWMTPSDLVTCWIALDDTTVAGGALEYVAGSHHFGVRARIEQFDAPADPYAELDALLGPRVDGDLPLRVARVVVPRGSVAFHHGLLWHGSSSNRSDVDRRALGVHLMSSHARFDTTRSAGRLSRYRHLDDTVMDEHFFPITWSDDGRRSPWLRGFTS